MTQGWILDAHPDYERDSMVLWLWTPSGVQRIEDRSFRPSFFVRVPPAELPDLQRRLEILDQVAATRVVMKRTSLAAEEPEPLLEVVPRHYADLRDAARIVDSAGKYYEYEMFDVDLRLSQRYFLEHGIFPMGLVAYDGTWRPLEEHFALEYEIPDLRRDVLDVAIDAPAGIPRMDDRLLAASLGGDAVDGDEEDVVRGINALVEDHDPDIVFTDGGDAFLLPYLQKKAGALGLDLRLGRDPGFHGARSGKSYFTYGKIVYKPGQYLLKGRLHLDRGHFAVRESGFAGLVELSRLSTLPPQEQARLTPGTAFTSMQTNLARQDGIVVLWKKNLPEEFKTAEDLVLGDRGGFIFEPEVGLHEGVVEVDYASLYPNIMVKHNISQETLQCPCCLLNGQRVPGLKYHLCTRRLGLIPRVLRPLVERKRYYKRMKKERTPLQEVYEGRDTILKWLLVTCFSEDAVIPLKRNEKYEFERIDRLVNRYIPNGTGVAKCREDLKVLGYNEHLGFVEKRVAKVVKAQAPRELLKIRIEGNRELLVTSNHQFFVHEKGELRVKAAEELVPGDLLPVPERVLLKPSTPRTVNVARELLDKAPRKDLFLWRVKGEALKNAVKDHYDLILPIARRDGYGYRSIWLWRKSGILPLKYAGLLLLTQEEWDSLEIGRTWRPGGKIQFLPAHVEIDEETGFLLGFYAGDGSASGNMVRFGIGMRESEIVGKLLDIIFRKFQLIGRVFKEKKANMWVLQVNSLALKEILRIVFGIGWSAETGKLVVPQTVLNGSEELRWAFLSGLIASDGYVHDSGNYASIASANYGFIREIGFLALTLGLRVRYGTAKNGKFKLYNIYMKTSEIQDEVWLKDFHRERADRWKSLVPKKSPEDFRFLPVKSIETVPYEKPYVYCFEVEGDFHGFVTVDGVFVGQSFGYQGYKNARYGRIECHEAINAYARDLLLESMRIAEQHGFEVVHGIVDSMWLRPTAKSGDVRKLIEALNHELGLPIDLEGTYRWLVFLPCKTTGVGALNRYYGLFETGEFKLRGIELRKHDTPNVVNKVQERILKELARAKSADEFKSTIPRCVDLVRGTAKALRENRVPLADLVVTKTVTKTLGEYLVMTATVAALKQLKGRGFAVEPGEYVRYVILDESAKEAEAKVRPAQFLTGGEIPDAQAYVRLICRAGETLFAPFGYTEERLLAACRRTKDAPDVDLHGDPELGGSGAREGHYPGTGIGYHATYAADEELLAEER